MSSQNRVTSKEFIGIFNNLKLAGLAEKENFTINLHYFVGSSIHFLSSMLNFIRRAQTRISITQKWFIDTLIFLSSHYKVTSIYG